MRKSFVNKSIYNFARIPLYKVIRSYSVIRGNSVNEILNVYILTLYKKYFNILNISSIIHLRLGINFTLTTIYFALTESPNNPGSSYIATSRKFEIIHSKAWSGKYKKFLLGVDF